MSKIISLKDWLDESPQRSATDQRVFLTEEAVADFLEQEDNHQYDVD